MRSSSTWTSTTGREELVPPALRSYSSKGHPGGSAAALREGCLGSLVSYKPLARSPGGKAYFASPQSRPGQGQLAVYSEVPSDCTGAAAPSFRSSTVAHEVLLSETSKPRHARRVDEPSRSFPDDEDSTLDASAPRRNAGLAPARSVEPRGPLTPAARSREHYPPRGNRGTRVPGNRVPPAEFKVDRTRSCGCSIMRSDGTHVFLKSFRQNMQ